MEIYSFQLSYDMLCLQKIKTFRVKHSDAIFIFYFLKIKNWQGFEAQSIKDHAQCVPQLLNYNFEIFPQAEFIERNTFEFDPFPHIRKLTAQCCFSCFSLHLIHIFLWHVQNSITQNARHNQNVAKTTQQKINLDLCTEIRPKHIQRSTYGQEN